MKTQLKVGSIVMVPIAEKRWAVWKVTGIYLGGESQEGTIGMTRLDILQSDNKIIVPMCMIDAIDTLELID